MDELTYEDVPAEQGQAGAGRVPASANGVDVMSNQSTSIGKTLVESVAISPISGAILPANADTASRARAGRVAKRERYRAAAEQGLLTAGQAVALGVMSPEDAWRKVIEAQSELALSPDVRGSTQAAALVGKAIGATEREHVDAATGNSIHMSLSDAAVTQIALAIAGKLDQDE
jgi:hypothetical protein